MSNVSALNVSEESRSTMAKGIIYVMTTVVPGLVKIGKTMTNNFEQRMYSLERNGYFNVTGLKRAFAIEVSDYDEKEAMLDDIFSRSRVPNSELFALDVDLVIQLLSSFEGEQKYPETETETKEQVFKHATEKHASRPENNAVPDGTYYLRRKIKRIGEFVEAVMQVKGDKYIIPKGTKVCTIEGKGLSYGIHQMRERFINHEGKSTEDVEFRSPSGACSFVIGAPADGWKEWKNSNGDFIDIYREGEK